LCTVVGRDVAGVAIRAELDRLGLLGPGAVETAESSLGVVLTDGSGYRMGFPFLAPVDGVAYPLDTFTAQAAGTDLLVLTNARFVRPLVGPASDLGIPIAVDVHLIDDVEDAYNRPWLEAAEIVFCSHERLPEPPAAWVARLFACHPRCRIAGVGLGAGGALIGLRDGRLVQVSAAPAGEIMNTAGAGDCLFATFLHEWLRTWHPVHALQSAVVHSDWKVAHHVPSNRSLSGPELQRSRLRRPPVTRIGRWDGTSARASGF
jgi:sugar/nucleoside kinase (ribokinase family)